VLTFPTILLISGLIFGLLVVRLEPPPPPGMHCRRPMPGKSYPILSEYSFLVFTSFFPTGFSSGLMQTPFRGLYMRCEGFALAAVSAGSLVVLFYMDSFFGADSQSRSPLAGVPLLGPLHCLSIFSPSLTSLMSSATYFPH